MHLIQVSDKQWIDAEKIKEIQENSSASFLFVVDGGEAYQVCGDYRKKAIQDILNNCTPTSGRDALQRIVSE